MRIRQRTYELQTFSRVSEGALAFLWLIVVTGATVRLTGSGLGCPDWPSCSGARPVPGLDHHALIEFGNRLVSLPTTVLTLAAWFVAPRLRIPRRDLRWGARLIVAGVVAQIVLGGLTVRLELPPIVVAAHFLVSIGILTAATYTTYAARREVAPRLGARGAKGVDRVVAVGVVAMLAVCAFVIAAGVATTASGPHSGAEAGFAVARLGDFETAVTYHARAAYLFAGLVLGLTIVRRRSRAGARDVLLLSGLIAAQIVLGEVQYRNGLPWGIVLAHVASAALVWVVTCWVAIGALSAVPAASGTVRA